jgi:hypothetical protein
VIACYLEQSGLEESSIRRRFARARSSHLWTPEPLRRGYFSSPYALELASGLDPAIIATIASSASGALRPEQISGMLLDLDAEVVTTTGSAVTTWPDQSGLAHDFTDAGVSTRRPTAESDTWRAGSGIASVLFDGSSDYLTCTTSLATDFAGGDDNAYTWAGVFQFAATPTGYHALFACSSSSVLSPFVDFGTDTASGPIESWRVGRADDGGGNDTRHAGITPDTARHVLVVVFHGTTIDMWLDGVELLTLIGASHSHNVGTCTFDQATIGARSRGSGPTVQGESNARIARALCYDHAITVTEAKGLSRYLRSHYRVAA